MAYSPKPPLDIFYDGSCGVCAREMEHYRRRDPGGLFRFIDISAEDFNPGNYGRSREEFMLRMHVRDGSGRFHVGVDGFIAIWSALPGRGWRCLAGLVRLPGVHLLAAVGYRVFARLRRYLPKRSGTCASGHCRIGEAEKEKGGSE